MVSLKSPTWCKVSPYLVGIRAIAPAELLFPRGDKCRQLWGRLRGRKTLLFLNALVTEHQVHQVFLLPAGVGGDVTKQQVLTQVPDSQAHEQRALKGRCVQQMTCCTNAQVLLEDGAQRAEALLAVAANVLQKKTGWNNLVEIMSFQFGHKI